MGFYKVNENIVEVGLGFHIGGTMFCPHGELIARQPSVEADGNRCKFMLIHCGRGLSKKAKNSTKCHSEWEFLASQKTKTAMTNIVNFSLCRHSDPDLSGEESRATSSDWGSHHGILRSLRFPLNDDGWKLVMDNNVKNLNFNVSDISLRSI